MTPDISVIVPVYNAERYLREAVASALAQPEVAQVLLVEDGSPDGSLAECERLAAQDARVRLLRHPAGANRGAGASRNLGIAEARSEYIAFLDADDYYLPDRFGAARRLLAQEAVDGVYEITQLAFESAAARERFQAVRGAVTRPDGVMRLVSGVPPEQLGTEVLSGRAGFCHLDGLTLRRSLLARSGVFLESLRLHQDTHLLIRLAHHGRLVEGETERPVAVCRIHEGNRITRATRSVSLPYQRAMWRDLLDWGLRERCPVADLRLIMYRHFLIATDAAQRQRVGGRKGRLLHLLRLAAFMTAESLRSPARMLRYAARVAAARPTG